MDAKETFIVLLLTGTLLASKVETSLGFQIANLEDDLLHGNNYYLQQATPDPLVFKYQPIFEGNWISQVQNKQFNEFANTKGWARCQFAYRTPDPTSTKMFFLEVVDGVHCF